MTTTIPDSDFPLWDIDDLAKYLRVSTATIYGLRHRRDAPPAYKIGRELRWRKSQVDAWLAERAGAGKTLDTSPPADLATPISFSFEPTLRGAHVHVVVRCGQEGSRAFSGDLVLRPQEWELLKFLTSSSGDIPTGCPGDPDFPHGATVHHPMVVE